MKMPAAIQIHVLHFLILYLEFLKHHKLVYTSFHRFLNVSQYN